MPLLVRFGTSSAPQPEPSLALRSVKSTASPRTPKQWHTLLSNAVAPGKTGLVQKGVPVHKPDAQAKDTALCKTTSRNKRVLREWFESLDPSLARQACRLELVTLRLSRLNCAGKRP